VGFRGGGERESGLVGLLVVLVVLGAMAAVAFTALGGSDGEPTSNPSGLAAEVVPAAKADLGAVARSGEALRTGIADQASNACTADVRTVATAVAAYEASRGSYPGAVDQLVTAGLLTQAPSSPGYAVTLESTGGKPTGRVLVNGMDPSAGCEAPTG
jgi:hypothetical protein